MTRKEALQELLVKVKEDLDTAHHHAAAFPSESAGGHCTWHDSHKASSGSMDAALSLFEAVLPGWEWWLESTLGASIKLQGTRYWSNHIPFSGTTPSRALLIAILEGLVGMEDE